MCLQDEHICISPFQPQMSKNVDFRWSQFLFLRRSKSSQPQNPFSSQMHVHNSAIFLCTSLCWSMTHSDLCKELHLLIFMTKNTWITLNSTCNLPFQPPSNIIPLFHIFTLATSLILMTHCIWTLLILLCQFF